MSGPAPARSPAGGRREARALLAVLALATLFQTGVALVESVELARVAWSQRRQSHAEATRRELGGTYFHALSVARRALPLSGPVYFVDEQREASGAAYFALYYLAPRRLVRVGSTRESSADWLRRQVPAGVDNLLVVGGSGAPLEVVPVTEYGVARGDF